MIKNERCTLQCGHGTPYTGITNVSARYIKAFISFQFSVVNETDHDWKLHSIKKTSMLCLKICKEKKM